jgi:hypothetical protein
MQVDSDSDPDLDYVDEFAYSCRVQDESPFLYPFELFDALESDVPEETMTTPGVTRQVTSFTSAETAHQPSSSTTSLTRSLGISRHWSSDEGVWTRYTYNSKFPSTSASIH